MADYRRTGKVLVSRSGGLVLRVVVPARSRMTELYEEWREALISDGETSGKPLAEGCYRSGAPTGD